MLYLEKGSRPELAQAVHQCARFSADPRREHGEAVKWIGRYLAGTRDKGLILKPTDDSFDVYADADFSGNWDAKVALEDRDTARSRHGYVVLYAGCPIVWASQLQTEIALSSTESEIYGLSQALRTMIPLMELIKEMKNKGFPIGATIPRVHCRVFEDNAGAIEITRNPKYRPRTKHINIKYHHYRSYVDRKEIEILPIPTDLQPADMLTKPLSAPLFKRHREKILGW